MSQVSRLLEDSGSPVVCHHHGRRRAVFVNKLRGRPLCVRPLHADQDAVEAPGRCPSHRHSPFGRRGEKQFNSFRAEDRTVSSDEQANEPAPVLQAEVETPAGAYAMAREWRETDGRSGLPVIDLGHVLRVPRHALEEMVGAELRAEELIESQPSDDTRPNGQAKPVRQIRPSPQLDLFEPTDD